MPAWAQYTQYTPPGSLPFPDVPTRERLEQARSEARWHLGGLRLEPWLALHDVGWVDNVFATSGEPTSDYTATAGAGVRGYTGVGPKTVLALHALPEYVWWQELEERRAWNGRYGAGLFGYFNHVELQLSATTARQAQYLSSEVEQPVNVRTDRGFGLAELRLSGHLGLFASAEGLRYRYREEDVSGPAGELLLGLDRDEARLRGGVRFAVGRGLSVGLGVEQAEVDFARPDNDCSSSGTSPLVELRWARPGLSLSVLALAADLEPEPGSRFLPFDDPLGRAELRWKPKGKVEWQLYGSSNLVYSLSQASPYYTEQRLGLGASIPFGWRSSVRLYAEDGANDYPGDAASLDSDVVVWGATASFVVYKRLVLTVGASQSRYEYADGRSSDVTRVQTGIGIGGAGGEWW